MTNDRNKPCWCGSGKKYKKCHLGRQQEMRPNSFELAAKHRQLFGHKTCLHPNAAVGACATKVVKAHSVRRAADLVVLADKGHVVQIRNDFEILHKTKGKPSPQLVGINDASTFTGFCATHDAATFAPVEAVAFTGSQEQCFLLFYRAWSRETYTKIGASRTIPSLRASDRGRTVPVQRKMQQFLDAMAGSIDLGLRDVRKYKSLLDQALVAQDYAVIQSRIIEVADRLPFLCSGAFYPYWDVEGTELQMFVEAITPEPIALTVLIEGNRSFAVMSYFRDHSTAPDRFVDALCRSPNIADALCRIAYSGIENVFADPRWWNRLALDRQEELVQRMANGASPFHDPSGDYLAQKGDPFVSTPIRRVFTV